MAPRYPGRYRRFPLLFAALSAWMCPCVAHGCPGPAEDIPRYVIHVSVDGLRGDIVRTLGPQFVPNFHRLRIEGAFTENARTDYDYTITLPNHACELTSRPVLGADGHGVDFNSDDGRTLAQIHGSYVAGVFDVAHDNGLSTGMYVSKSKFALFNRSWDEVNGALDVTGGDDGRDKIDTYLYTADTEALVATFIAHMEAAPHRYAFIHLRDPDAAGHVSGWESWQYSASIMKVDRLLGGVFDLVEGDARLSGATYIVVVADHGGIETDHSDAENPACYTIPLYVWGPGIPAGADLYWLNPVTRQNPGGGRPVDAAVLPIRNGEAANLSLDLLGLPSVNGSSLDVFQDLEPVLPGGAGALPAVSITNPAPGTSLVYPSPVVIEASADAGTGAITRLEFFENCIPLGLDWEAPYECAWNEIPLGVYWLTARAFRSDGIAATARVDLEMMSAVGVSGGLSMPPQPLRLYPNPVDRYSTIEFFLAAGDAVKIDIYDCLGRRVETVFEGRLEEGPHELDFDAGRHSPGVYFLRLRLGNAVRAGKLMIVR